MRNLIILIIFVVFDRICSDLAGSGRIWGDLVADSAWVWAGSPICVWVPDSAWVPDSVSEFPIRGPFGLGPR